MIDCVLINYKRPANIPLIIDSLKNQTVKNNIILIDAAPDLEFALDNNVIQSADLYIKLSKNFWAFNRFITLLAYQSEFVCFLDDDILPGREMLENYLFWAEKIENYGILGQKGRIITGPDYPIKQLETASFIPKKVSNIIQNYFIQSKHLIFLHKFMLDVKFNQLCVKNDDLSFSLAMIKNGLDNYVIPASGGKVIDKTELNNSHAFHRLPGHLESRNEFVKKYWIN